MNEVIEILKHDEKDKTKGHVNTKTKTRVRLVRRTNTLLTHICQKLQRKFYQNAID